MQKKTWPVVRNAKKAAKKASASKAKLADGGRWVTSDGGSKLYIADGGDVHAGGPKGPVIVGSTAKKKGSKAGGPNNPETAGTTKMIKGLGMTYIQKTGKGDYYGEGPGKSIVRGKSEEDVISKLKAKKAATGAKVSEYGKTKSFDKNDVVMVKDGDEEFSGKVIAKTAKGWKLDVSGDIPGNPPIEVKASNLKYLRKGKPTKKKPNTGHKLPYYD